METTGKNQNSKDFARASYTAVVSDLHLCEAEPIHPKFPLWKKFKTREFFFDEEFKVMLSRVHERAGGKDVELVLNGDIFDFDSVVSLPDEPPYRVSWLENIRGMNPQEPKSVFKIKTILHDHSVWVGALRDFLLKGHRAIFVVGNHDLELYFPAVQKEILKALDLPEAMNSSVRFCDWFYISNQDTLIEHSHQYDPYCVCQNPINPFILRHNQVEVRVPFGNWAMRYLINGMPFFNPHSDTNFLMSFDEYIKFFTKYLLRMQPLIVWTWFWGSVFALFKTFSDALRPELKDPLKYEDQIDQIAHKANASPRMVRELRELQVHSGSANPLGIARELWLDRAFLVMLAFLGIFQAFVHIKLVYNISFFWMFVPLAVFVPFFIFYARSITPDSAVYKEPRDEILALSSQITRTKRIVYGHTHIVRHEMVGDVELMNCGTWSPAFLDVECTKPAGRKTVVLISPDQEGGRTAQVLEFREGDIRELHHVERRAS